MQINATHKDSGISRSVNFHFGDANDVLQKYDIKIVCDAAVRSWVIAIQGIIRAKIGKALKDETEIPDNKHLQSLVDLWVPGACKPRVSAVDKTRKAIDNLTDEQRAELIREYNEALQQEVD